MLQRHVRRHTAKRRLMQRPTTAMGLPVVMPLVARCITAAMAARRCQLAMCAVTALPVTHPCRCGRHRAKAIQLDHREPVRVWLHLPLELEVVQAHHTRGATRSSRARRGTWARARTRRCSSLSSCCMRSCQPRKRRCSGTRRPPPAAKPALRGSQQRGMPRPHAAAGSLRSQRLIRAPVSQRATKVQVRCQCRRTASRLCDHRLVPRCGPCVARAAALHRPPRQPSPTSRMPLKTVSHLRAPHGRPWRLREARCRQRLLL